MNENKIIDRKFFADLAEEYALNTSHFEWLGGVRHPEIVVKGDMLDRLIELQSQFKRLEVMGDIQPDGNTLVSCRFHIHGAKSNPVYRKYTRFVVSNYSSYVSDNNEYYNDEWSRETITRIFAYLRRLVDAIISV